MQNILQIDQFISIFLKYLCKKIYHFEQSTPIYLFFPETQKRICWNDVLPHSILSTAQVFIKHNDWVEGNREEANHCLFFMFISRALKTHMIKHGESGMKNNPYFPCSHFSVSLISVDSVFISLF